MRAVLCLILLASIEANDFSRGFARNILAPFNRAVKSLERTGVPSYKPTRYPTISPTDAPTDAPTYSAGWMVKKSYYGTCDSAADRVDALRSGVCMKTYDDDHGEDYWMKVTCYGDEAQVNYYSDNECRDDETNFNTFSTECSASDDSNFAYVDVSCTTSDELPLSDFISYSYLLSYSTDDDSCDEDNAVRLLAFQDGSCFSNTEDHSVTTTFPDIFTYTTSDCTGDFTTSSIVKANECVITEEVIHNNGTDDISETNYNKTELFYYYGFYSDNHNEGSKATDGSFQWSLHSSADADFSFTGKSNIAGILPTDFDDNFDANSLVVAYAVASAIGQGIDYTDVTVKKLNLNVAELRRRLETASTDVTYKVEYNARDLNFDSESEAQESLTAALVASVEAGNFTTLLQYWNGASGVSADLSEVTSDKVQVDYDGAPDSDDDSGSEWANRASANVISGVIVGIGLVLLVVGGFYAFKAFSGNKE